jgi:hypothetical protein
MAVYTKLRSLACRIRIGHIKSYASWSYIVAYKCYTRLPFSDVNALLLLKQICHSFSSSCNTIALEVEFEILLLVALDNWHCNIRIRQLTSLPD